MRLGPEGARVDESTLRRRVTEAQAGDERALEDVVRAVQDDVFDLALRMLGDAADASDAAQEVLVRPAAFRKRLSRARRDMEGFMRAHCGLVNPELSCRCAKLVPAAVEGGLVDPDRPVLTRLRTREADRLRLDVERARSAAEVYRSLPRYAAPEDFARALRGVLAGQGQGTRP